MTRILLWLVLLLTACDLSNSVAQRPHGPSRVTIGPLVTSAWLPAGLDAFHFSDADQQVLAELRLTHIQWLQRAEREGRSAEEWAMAFASDQGMAMPVYYEAPGFSPYDKLRNWATMTSPDDSFDVAVEQRITALHRKWETQPAFAGYLIGHEDYRASTYEALARSVSVLRRIDPHRPAISVGAIDSYPQRNRFLDALFVEGGEPNVFQHEHYVYNADVEAGSERALRRLRDLVKGYDNVARLLRDRHGRWHGIVQVHAESRDAEPFYRPPTPAEISVQVGLALSRGASGIVYFLYSSGLEEVLNGAGEIVQRRIYEGLVDADRQPNERYRAAQALNDRLRVMSESLADRRFLGGYPAPQAPADEPVTCADADADLAYYGDDAGTSHVLIVNRRTDGSRGVEIELVTGITLHDVEGTAAVDGTSAVNLEAGGFRLFRIRADSARD